jgi:Flp pilus assembly protein TadG
MSIIKHPASIPTHGNNPAGLRKSERGQSLVELAVSITVILLLLAGAVDFSIAYFSFAAMQDAAQEGALYGSVNPTDTAGIITRVRRASSNPVDLENETLVNVTVTLNGDACEGNEVTVNVIYDYPISMPFIGAIIGSQTITLNASVTDTILQPPCSGSP